MHSSIHVSIAFWKRSAYGCTRRCQCHATSSTTTAAAADE